MDNSMAAMPDSLILIKGIERTKILTTVFIDASSAILLYKAGLFERSAQVFSLTMAGQVFRELTLANYPGTGLFKTMAAGGGIRIRKDPDPDACRDMEGFIPMDRGEQETLALYMQSGQGGFVLMDDGQGARFCRRHSIPFINALLVPKIFWYSGVMDAITAKKEMEGLAGMGRYSSRIISKALALSEKDLAFFIPGEARP